MFKVKNLTVKYGEREIISSQSFEIKSGKITAVIGRNGSGKSTLISALAGGVRYGGEIFFGGSELLELASREKAKKISFLPQIMPSPQFSVYELVSLGRSPHTGVLGKMSQADREAVEKAMVRVGIEKLCDRRADRISGGELRLAYVAMILAQDTEVILLDEPGVFMDMANERELYALLSSLKKEGKTVVVAVHNLSSAIGFADEIILLDDGKIVFCGEREACLESAAIESNFSVAKHTDGENIWFS